ncbi:CerR family C-terminal domain-containing protein [Desulfovibrio sulfodismutans]|uniref:CerR family C-terminal domain-containing protein n=1 Tax=Desulfolutivibrio sulfodismutans TaxID=63561 RepID=A0A7K3NLV5_9BACT|nr:CerR family C-terminal domain-containing protein [Desulfolutivibrio sulfodismutans]NDY57180.1 CerR family C-terminal domain-containing protein [Desulfolutivibrio sulfodismutans]
MTRSPRCNVESGARPKLIDAGVRLFGLHGFEATSTRSLAAEAGVNLAAIPYHFGGKEGLYQAVVQHIVDAKNDVLGPYFERIRALCADPAADRDTLLSALRAMIRALAADTLGASDGRDASQIMIQEQISPTPAFDLLYEGFFRPALDAWTGLVARLTSRDAAHPDTRLRAMALLGQMVIFRVGAFTALRHLDFSQFTRQDVERIAEICIEQIEACLVPPAGISPEAAS